MIDIVREIDAVQPFDRPAWRPARAASSASNATTTPRSTTSGMPSRPERIGRWFLPLSGDFRVGGRYQLEGNAGGEILACDQPNGFKVSWVYGEVTSPADVREVEVRLTAVDAATTRLVLEHVAIVPEDRWAEYGPGAVGVGWDGAVLGLSLYLRGGAPSSDPIGWQVSDEGRAFSTRSSERWGEANEAAGADREAAARSVANTTQFYAPDPETVS